MHAIRPAFRALAGVSLVALGFAAQPALAASVDAPAATPAGAPIEGPIVSGRIYDASGLALPGARIVVEGTGAQATTNLQGEFTVATPDANGDVTLLIDYLGRSPVTRTITAAERGRAVSFTLPAASGGEGDIVVVGASLVDNTARALNQQRTADNTITVISADAIGRFPDPNIAEALQRAPGVGIERDQARAATSTSAARRRNGRRSRSTASRSPRSTRRRAPSTSTRSRRTSSPIWKSPSRCSPIRTRIRSRVRSTSRRARRSIARASR